MIDLIVMRQNSTADETLIQIGKRIPRQEDSILDKTRSEKPVLRGSNLSLKPVCDNSSRTGAQKFRMCGIKIESPFPLCSSHAEEKSLLLAG
ncbi:MAG: hypothetical protein ACJ708_08935, partial [Nitrososphaeraceae archaeon]